jgi:E3 ubiquitin-protein ligase DRIP
LNHNGLDMTRLVTRKVAAAYRGLCHILDPIERHKNGNTNNDADDLSLLDSLSKVPQTRINVKYN